MFFLRAEIHSFTADDSLASEDLAVGEEASLAMKQAYRDAAAQARVHGIQAKTKVVKAFWVDDKGVA